MAKLQCCILWVQFYIISQISHEANNIYLYCEFSSSCFFLIISVLLISWRRTSALASGPQASQLRTQQSQQSFSQGISSQHGIVSQLSQSSLDEIVTNDQVESHFGVIFRFALKNWRLIVPFFWFFHLVFAESIFSRTRNFSEEVLLLTPS